MEVSMINDVPVYNLTSRKSLPGWLSESLDDPCDSSSKKKKNKQKSSAARARDHQKSGIQLLQHFEMPVASDNICVTADQQFVLATGTYKPRLRCYDVNDMGMKFERCFDASVLDFVPLTRDFTKLVFIHSDRSISVHSQQGVYYKLRLPTVCRSLAYNLTSCDAYAVGFGSQAFRLNLEQGTFHAPLETGSPANNVVAVHHDHDLVCIGSTNGKIEAWDPRSRERVSTLHVNRNGLRPIGGRAQVTALAFDNVARHSMAMAVGTDEGVVLMYDLRSDRAVAVRDHRYSTPIKKMRLTRDMIFSMDAQSLKMWTMDDSNLYTSIESDFELNDFDIFADTGLMVLAGENPQMQIRYVPSLGPAPRWASFLDGLAEEAAEGKTDDDLLPQSHVYDNYKFVPAAELTELGLDDLIGTPMLRAYMHGYFVDLRLYRRSITERKLSASMPDRVEEEKADVENESEEDEVRMSASYVNDDRFAKKMMTDAKFIVDTESDVYKLIHPVVVAKSEKRVKKVQNEERQVESAVVDSSGDEIEEEELDDSEASDEESEHDEPLPVITNWTEVISGEDKREAKTTLETKLDQSAAKADKSSSSVSKVWTFESKDKCKAPGQINKPAWTATDRFKSRNSSHMQERQLLRRKVGSLKNMKRNKS